MLPSRVLLLLCLRFSLLDHPALDEGKNSGIVLIGTRPGRV